MIQKTVFSLLLFAASLTSAAEGQHGPKGHDQKLGPAPVYSGNTPIDRSHGLLFNNGTYGVRNPSIEEWATTPVLFPGISEKFYPYSEREHFLRGAAFQVEWAKAALNNYKAVTEVSRPEGVQHAKEAITALEPSVERLESALDKANGAGAGDWESAQDQLRRAIVDFRLAYTQMHKNVHL